jgi:DNA-binding transcriptional LysR family regulator
LRVRKSLTVGPQGAASFDDPDLVIQAVLDGVGIGTAMGNSLEGLIAEVPIIPGLFPLLSQPSQRAALAALIDSLRLD